jgi:hypothetical protein
VVKPRRGVISFVIGMIAVAGFILAGGWIAAHPWAGIILLGTILISFLGILTVLFLTLPRTPRH